MNTRPLLAAGLALLSLAAFAKDPTALQGKKFPAFHMVDTNGKTVTNASLKGKVVLIDFWATWCPPCRAATPTLQRLQQKYGAQGLVVIGADTFERSPEAQKSGAKMFAQQNKLTYRMTLMNDKFAESLGIQGIPTMFIIDKKGIVRKVNVGFGEEEVPSIEAAVTALLRK